MLKIFKSNSKQMLYYRFRPYNELSLKELMYNEMYFASTEECNDPFDSKSYYTFGNDIEKWVNLILFALSNFQPKPELTGEQLKALTDFFIQKCPLSFEDLMMEDILGDFPAKTVEDDILVRILKKSIPQIAKIYKPSQSYFVSFAKDPKEILMWSHYANKHHGFCLIFRPINGTIKQFEFRKRRQINRKTPNSFAQEISYSFPDEFKIKDIEYVERVIPSNAFLHMPIAVTGDIQDKKYLKRIRSDQERHYFQKAISWQYEKEARLIFSPPPSWLFGENIEYEKQERLFHYDSSHLVGIIYGARLSEGEKKRIQQILKEKEEWEDYYPARKRIIFNFIEFECRLSKNQREVEIEPIALNFHQKTTDFERLYKDWVDGWGFERDMNRYRKIKVD